MDRSKFYEVSYLYSEIQLLQDKEKKMYDLRRRIIKILKGHLEIPEEELLSVFNGLEKLSKYLEKDIERLNKKIDEL